MADEKVISKEDLASLKDAKTKSAFLAMKAEKAVLEAQLAEAEKRNHILNMYIKYGLSAEDIIDESSGLVKAKEDSKEKV